MPQRLCLRSALALGLGAVGLLDGLLAGAREHAGELVEIDLPVAIVIRKADDLDNVGTAKAEIEGFEHTSECVARQLGAE